MTPHLRTSVPRYYAASSRHMGVVGGEEQVGWMAGQVGDVAEYACGFLGHILPYNTTRMAPVCFHPLSAVGGPR